MDPSLLGHPIPTPTARKRTGVMTKRTLFVALAVIAAIAAGAFMLLGSQDNSGQLQQRLSARQATTLRLIADGQKNIESDDLAKLNSELSIVLTGDNVTLQSALKTAGMKKADKTVVAAEADTETFTKLKTAKLNAQYDASYKNVLIQKLESLQALLQELHGKTKSKSLKSALATEYEHVARYHKTLSETPN